MPNNQVFSEPLPGFPWVIISRVYELPPSRAARVFSEWYDQLGRNVQSINPYPGNYGEYVSKHQIVYYVATLAAQGYPAPWNSFTLSSLLSQFCAENFELMSALKGRLINPESAIYETLREYEKIYFNLTHFLNRNNFYGWPNAQIDAFRELFYTNARDRITPKTLLEFPVITGSLPDFGEIGIGAWDLPPITSDTDTAKLLGIPPPLLEPEKPPAQDVAPLESDHKPEKLDVSPVETPMYRKKRTL